MDKRTTNSVTSRLMSLFLTVCMVIGMVPTAIADVFAQDDKFAVVSPITNGGAGSGYANGTYVFKNTTLEYSEADPSIGRFRDGWWLGIRVDAPDYDVDILKVKSKYRYVGSTDVMNFWDNKDSKDDQLTGHYIGLWGIVNEEYLANSLYNGKKTLTYSYEFDWDGNGVYEDKIEMQLDSTTVTLMKNGDKVYPASSNIGTVVSATAGLEVDSTRSNYVYASFKNAAALSYVEANGANPPMAGWWAGLNVIAPAGTNFENAKYQSMSGGSWGASKPVDKDGEIDGAGYMGVWGYVDPAILTRFYAEGRLANYVWRFDWNGDGVFEQIVHLAFDASKLTLKNAGGEQVYPSYATVTPITGGTVSENNGNIEYIVDNVTLSWAAAGNGRGYDGWWAGALVTAPENYTKAQLDKAKYTVSSSSSTSVSGWNDPVSRNFIDNRDTDTTMQIWLGVTAELMKKYADLDKDIAAKYEFDWNDDGEIDQTIIIKVETKGAVKLAPIDQSGLEFDLGDNPSDVFVGESITNTLTGGQTDGAVEYAITKIEGVDEADYALYAAIDAEGKLTFKLACTVTVTATKAGGFGYNDTAKSYTVSSKRYDQTANFDKSEYTVDFVPDQELKNEIVNLKPEDYTDIKFSIDNANVAVIDENTGVVTLKGAGEATVTAEIAQSDAYTASTITYKLVVNPGTQAEVKVEIAPITYTTETIDLTKNAEGGSGEGAFVFAIKGESDVASVTVEGKLTVNKMGSFTLVVYKAADANYKQSASVEIPVIVNRADQSEIKFSAAEQGYTYNDAPANKFNALEATGGESSEDLVYSIIEAEGAEYVASDVAVIDDKTGEITVKAAGEVYVVVTRPADDKYNATTSKYKLTVKKDDPSVIIGDVNITYGQDYTFAPLNNNADDTNDFTYSVIGNNKLGLTIDADGKIAYADNAAGTVKVEITKPANACYNEYRTTVLLKVLQDYTPDADTIGKIEAIGDIKDGWYKDNVTLKAPEGYQISKTNSQDGWTDTVEFGEDASFVRVYLRNNAAKSISTVIRLDKVKIDKTAPSSLSVRYVDYSWSRAASAIFFGFVDTKPVQVEFKATDKGSGIEKLVLDIAGEQSTVYKKDMTEKNGNIVYTHNIDTDVRGKVIFTAYDYAGNMTKYEYTDKTSGKYNELVVDYTSPELEVSYGFDGNRAQTEDGIEVTDGTITVNFAVTEANFDLVILENAPVPTVNGVAQDVEWKYDDIDGKWKATFTISAEGDHVIELVYNDLSHGEAKTFTDELHIDKTEPKIKVDYVDVDGEPSNTNYYQGDRTAVITVEEHHFVAANTVIDITALDKELKTVDMYMDFAAYLKDAANWTQDPTNPDVYKAEITFLDDANYSVSYHNGDILGNDKQTVTDTFTIDVVAPTIKFNYPAGSYKSILEALSLGFFVSDEKATVEVTITDEVAGVDFVTLTYDRQNGADERNTEVLVYNHSDLVHEEGKNYVTITQEVPAEARGSITVSATDKSGNVYTETDSNNVIVADTNAPAWLEPVYEFEGTAAEWDNDIFVTDKKVTVTLTIDDANFDLVKANGIVPELTVTNKETNASVSIAPEDGEWKQDEKGNWKASFVVGMPDGDYVLSFSTSDLSGNVLEKEYFQEIHFDTTAPTVKVEYVDADSEPSNGNYYDNNRTAVITVEDHHFVAAETSIVITALDANGKTVAMLEDYEAYLKDAANWTQDPTNPDVYKAEITFSKDANYRVEYYSCDLLGNNEHFVIDEFTVDHVAPTIEFNYPKNSYKKLLEAITFGMIDYDVYVYGDKAIVEVTITDDVAGVDFVTLTYDRQDGADKRNTETLVFNYSDLVPTDAGKTVVITEKIPAEARGSITVVATDKSGNVYTETDSNNIIVADTNAPAWLEPVYEFEGSFAEWQGDVYVTDKNVTVTLTIDDANFDLVKANGIVPELTVTNKETNTSVSIAPNDNEWKQDDSGNWKASFVVGMPDGDYVLSFSTSDLSGKVLEKEYFQEIHFDTTAPTVEVEYVDKDSEVLNGNFYQDDRTAVITVTDHHFVAAETSIVITALDANGKTVAMPEDYEAYLKDAANWTQDPTNPDVYKAEITFSADANYRVEYYNCDLLGNNEHFVIDEFTVDHKKSEIPTLKLKAERTLLDSLVETLTFGVVRFDSDLKLTFTATDATAGIDYFVVEYYKQADATGREGFVVEEKIYPESRYAEEKGEKSTATYTFPAGTIDNLRGSFKIYAYDRAGNVEVYDDKENISILDTISPEIKVEYTTDGTFHYTTADGSGNVVDVDSFDAANKVYSDKKVTATITVDDANFFDGQTYGAIYPDSPYKQTVIHHVAIKLNKTFYDINTGKYVTHTIEYLPEGADRIYADADGEVRFNWTRNGDVYTLDITYADDADYVLEIAYTDLSGNDAIIGANDTTALATRTYASDIITVDTTAPVLEKAEFVQNIGDTKVMTFDGREYYSVDRTLNLYIREHNFRFDEYKDQIESFDVTGKNYTDGNGNIIKLHGISCTQDAKDADVHIVTIKFTAEANYTFKYAYNDLASNAIVEGNGVSYVPEFTIDRTAPKDLTIKYQETLFDKFLNAITFGFYNDKINVVITATDDVAGIYKFVYEYRNAQNVSGVNAQLLGQTIPDPDVNNSKITQNGNVFSATFSIPRNALTPNSQFNGTVSFDAFDRSEHSTTESDTKRIVVDSISPTADVTYSEHIRESADGKIIYFDRDIDVTIKVTEANFYAENVNVYLTKDGVQTKPNVTWTKNTNDLHTGTFTISGDGDYYVEVDHTDYSKNSMATNYRSAKLVLDTTKPTVVVSKIKNDSANQDTPYSFTITVSDANLKADTLDALLSLVTRNEDGSFKTTERKNGEIGTLVTSADGNTVTITVDDLSEDGIYTLCSGIRDGYYVTDMSDNKQTMLTLTDDTSNPEIKDVTFSINRNGSTFGKEKDSYTEKLLESYYVYSVDEHVEIFEINPDPIKAEDAKIKVNGTELTTDQYEFSCEKIEGGWYKIIYRIHPNNFSEEGTYNIVVESVDKANTTAFSDVKNLRVSFVVDRTPPVITVTGIKKGGIYRVDQQTVTVTVTDEGGKLKGFFVNIKGKDTKDIDGFTPIAIEGDALQELLKENGGVFEFVIPAGFEHNIIISATDCAVKLSAGNTDSNTMEKTFEKVTVTTNKWLQFYADKPVFYSTIAAVVLVIGAVVFFVIKKKGKTEEAEG